jgi:hypothetical protein
MRPDLEVDPLRGNVDTRLRKLEEEGLDAVILACAGLDRLGLGDRIHERVDPDLLLPAVGQGTASRRGRDPWPGSRGGGHPEPARARGGRASRAQRPLASG